MGGTIVAGKTIFKSLINEPICAVHPYMEETMTALLESDFWAE